MDSLYIATWTISPSIVQNFQKGPFMINQAISRKYQWKEGIRNTLQLMLRIRFLRFDFWILFMNCVIRSILCNMKRGFANKINFVARTSQMRLYNIFPFLPLIVTSARGTSYYPPNFIFTQRSLYLLVLNI